jgi:hypothetical protein
VEVTPAEQRVRRAGDISQCASDVLGDDDAVGPNQIHRHPELVSGSIRPQGTPSLVARWMLKQVQHDGFKLSNPP